MYNYTFFKLTGTNRLPPLILLAFLLLNQCHKATELINGNNVKYENIFSKST